MKKTLSIALALIMMAAMFTAFAIPSSAALPAEYIQLEYAEGNGDQVILTEIFPSPKLKLEVDFQITDVNNKSGSAGVAGVVGAYMNGDKKPGRFQVGVSRTGTYFSIGMGDLLVKSTDLTPAFEKNTDRHQVVMDAVAKTITFDGKEVGTIADTKLIDTTDETNGAKLPAIILFGVNNSYSGTEVKASGRAASKIYSCKFYLDGTLIADFVPCKRVADNYVGMYDTVGKKFYENYLDTADVKTSLIAGPEVKTETTTAAATTGAVTTGAITTDKIKTDSTGDTSMIALIAVCGAVAFVGASAIVMRKKEN